MFLFESVTVSFASSDFPNSSSGKVYTTRGLIVYLRALETLSCDNDSKCIVRIWLKVWYMTEERSLISAEIVFSY